MPVRLNIFFGGRKSMGVFDHSFDHSIDLATMCEGLEQGISTVIERV